MIDFDYQYSRALQIASGYPLLKKEIGQTLSWVLETKEEPSVLTWALKSCEALEYCPESASNCLLYPSPQVRFLAITIIGKYGTMSPNLESLTHSKTSYVREAARRAGEIINNRQQYQSYLDVKAGKKENPVAVRVYSKRGYKKPFRITKE
jgi:hypothetical protein